MTPPRPWPDAALAGLACSIRSMSGPGVLAARGRVSGRPRVALLLAAGGELAADKSPLVIDRTAPVAWAGRITTGAVSGGVVAGPVGAAVAALSAGLGTYVTWRLRRLVGEVTRQPDWVVAVGEDLLCYTLATVATR